MYVKTTSVFTQWQPVILKYSLLTGDRILGNFSNIVFKMSDTDINGYKWVIQEEDHSEPSSVIKTNVLKLNKTMLGQLEIAKSQVKDLGKEKTEKEVFNDTIGIVLYYITPNGMTVQDRMKSLFSTIQATYGGCYIGGWQIKNTNKPETAELIYNYSYPGSGGDIYMIWTVDLKKNKILLLNEFAANVTE